MLIRRLRSDQGMSILEVLIALVVLSVAAVALLNGLQSSQAGARTVDKKANAIVALGSAAEVVSSQAFPGSCPAAGKFPFAGDPKLKALGVDVVAAKYQDRATGVWGDTCPATITDLSALKVQLRVAGSQTTARGATKWVLRLQPRVTGTFAVQVNGSSSATIDADASGKSSTTVILTTTDASAEVFFGVAAEYTDAVTYTVSDAATKADCVVVLCKSAEFNFTMNLAKMLDLGINQQQLTVYAYTADGLPATTALIVIRLPGA